MKTYAMYVGHKETRVPNNRIYLVGYYETPTSYIIRCKGTEFIYSTKKQRNINWKFFGPTTEPYEIY